MKALFALCCFLATTVLLPGLNAAEWFTDFAKAKAESMKTGRPIYVLFTNPDAAVCLSYERAIFSQRKFHDYAERKLVLMKVEFPVAIHKQQKALREQNSQLKSFYAVSIMPTALLVDAEGNLFIDFVKADGGQEKHRRIFNKIMDFDAPQRYADYVDGYVKKYKPPKPKVEEKTVAAAPAKKPEKKPAKKPAKKMEETQKSDIETITIPVENGGVPLVPIDPEGNFQDWLKANAVEETGAATAVAETVAVTKETTVAETVAATEEAATAETAEAAPATEEAAPAEAAPATEEAAPETAEK